MIDVRAARAEPERYRAALARKGAADSFDALLAADERRRELLPRIEELQARRKLKGKPTPEQLEELERLKGELQSLEGELAEVEAEVERLAAVVPNPPHESVPDGDTEEDAEVVRTVGEPPELEDPREHTEIGRFDMERAARLSGSRFGYWIGDVALLALALYRLGLYRKVADGFVPVLPPVLVREEALFGTGHFPTDEANVYELPADGLYLAGTAEIPLASLHRGKILEDDELPCGVPITRARLEISAICRQDANFGTPQGHVHRPGDDRGPDLRRAARCRGRARRCRVGELAAREALRRARLARPR